MGFEYRWEWFDYPSVSEFCVDVYLTFDSRILENRSLPSTPTDFLITVVFGAEAI